MKRRVSKLAATRRLLVLFAMDVMYVKNITNECGMVTIGPAGMYFRGIIRCFSSVNVVTANRKTTRFD